MIGPGMFTSLRVGLACVKGLALVNNIPIKGFNTLDALVFSLPASLIQEQRKIIPVIDVRREEVYYRIYQGLKPISEPLLTTPEIFLQQIPKDSLLLGTGTNRYLSQIKNFPENHFMINNLIYPSPVAIALHAQESISKQDISNIETLVPFYVR